MPGWVPTAAASADCSSSTVPSFIDWSSFCRLLTTCSSVSAIRLSESRVSTTNVRPSTRVPIAWMPVSGGKSTSCS